MSQALYRKWRPQRWDQVVGQEHVVQTLRNAVVAERVAHAYLFAGPRGTGKTTTARLLAKAVNCLEDDLSARPCDRCEHCKAVNGGHFLDLIEIDAASNTSVEDVRSLRDKINFAPNQGRYKVYIIDEVHMLSTAAFNALLKTLEEPPSHAIFILATTEVHKIPATVLSRCQRHEFRRIPVNDIVRCLKEMADGEGFEVEPEALALVARQSTGSLRDAISLLDQLASMGKKVSLSMAQTVLGTAASQAVLDVVDALVNKDAPTGLDHIHRALDAGSDPRQFSRQIVDYLRGLLLIRMGSASQIEAPPETRVQMARHAQQFDTPELLRVIRLFNQAAVDGRISWQPSLPLELAFVEALEEPGISPEPSGIEASQPEPDRSAAPRSRKAAPASPQTASQPEVESDDEPDDSGQPSDAPLAKLLQQRWKDIISQLRQRNPQAYGLLNSCKSRQVKNGTLIVGFSSEVLTGQMEKEGNAEDVKAVLQAVLGEGVELRCITLVGKRNVPPPDVDSDGVVAAAVRDLGGEIVDIQ